MTSTNDIRPTMWSSRWHSACKRFGIGMVAAIVALIVGAPPIVWIAVPLLAAGWGFVRPREYARKPSWRVRLSVSILPFLFVVCFGWVVWIALFCFGSSHISVPGEAFSGKDRNVCTETFRLDPEAWNRIRPGGFQSWGMKELFAEAAFFTTETDLSRIFNTNLADLSGVCPGGSAPNIEPRPAELERFPWWTPGETPALAGQIKLLNGRTNEWLEASVDVLPDGSRAIYVHWSLY